MTNYGRLAFDVQYIPIWAGGSIFITSSFEYLGEHSTVSKLQPRTDIFKNLFTHRTMSSLKGLSEDNSMPREKITSAQG